MIGKIINNYKITEFIEEGGMGTIYRASHLKLTRSVAVKVLHQNLTSNPQFKERFINEANILAKLSHPAIINIYDFIESDGQYFIITEFIEGETLADLISNNELNSIELILNLFRQILNGISYAHNNGIVHRDLKPSNIMVQSDNTVKILDFGIAKLSDSSKSLTKTGTKMGSLYYMSPEQVLGKEIDSRTDIYSLGIVLFEMLTKKMPYETNTDSDYELMDSILKQDIPDLNLHISGIDQSLNHIIQKATCKNPDNRFISCSEFLNAFSDNNFRFVKPVQEIEFTSSNKLNKKQIGKKTNEPLDFDKQNETKIILNEDQKMENLFRFEYDCDDCSASNYIYENEFDLGRTVCNHCNTKYRFESRKKGLFENSFSFKGRIRRLEYGFSIIIFYAAYFILGILITIITDGGTKDSNIESGIFSILFIGFYITSIWFSLAEGTKRCHDLGKPGIFQIIPLYVFWLLFQEGKKESNEYGSNPKGIIIETVEKLKII